MKRNLLKIGLLLGAMILIALTVSSFFPTPSPPTPKPLPNPNGYDVFVQAGAMLPSAAQDYRTMDRETLLALVESNTNALRLMRSGLDLECQVPLENFRPTTPGPGAMKDLINFRKLGYALAAEGKFAEMENRPADAAKSYIDAIRFGAESPRGGIIIHAMIGAGLESIGGQNLQRIASRLDAETCREAVRTVEGLDSRREAWQEVSQRDRDRIRSSYPGLGPRIAQFVMSRSTRSVTKKAEDHYVERVAETRRLILKLAARAYELEKHQKAKSFADLVPEYLKAIPQDPLTGTNMTFLP